MMAGYASLGNSPHAYGIYSLKEIGDFTEKCFMLPPIKDEEEQAQPTVGPTVGGPGYTAHKQWADSSDDDFSWDPPEILKSPRQDSQQDWTEVVHRSRSNTSSSTSFSGKIVNWYGKPVGFNKDGTLYSKKPYGWIKTENAIDGNNFFIFFTMPPGAKYGRQHGTTVQFDVEYNNTPIGRCANISHVVCF
jgi:hypothetical protein